MEVKVIDAKQGIEPQLRVAAYIRVSTGLEEQESSYLGQMKHYTDYISKHEGWILAGIYADEGISGTGVSKREQFKKMIEDCEKGMIDFVITKSISRFARNTLDCLKYIRKLKALDIPICFEKENINTMDASGELLITIMASIAQQESLSISQNVRLGHQYRFQQGKPLIRGGFMGYRMSEDKSHLVISAEEAIVVRRIYREFLDGKTPREIALKLEKDHVLSPGGKSHWYHSTIISMLRNEKYKGDLLLQKYYVKDFISKKAVKNNGVYPKYYVEDAHQPIVPKEIFNRVQNEFIRREREREKTGKRTCVYDIPLYGKISCVYCGHLYHRHANAHHIKWCCRNKCSSRNVDDECVREAVMMAFKKVRDYKDSLLHKKEELINNEQYHTLKEMKDLSKKQLLELSEMEYAIAQISNLIDFIDDGKDESAITKTAHPRFGKFYHEIQRQMALYDHACYEVSDFYERTRERRYGKINVFNNDDVIRYIDTIQVDDERLMVVFKAGISISIDK